MKDESRIDKALLDEVMSRITPKFKDARPLNGLERQHLCKLMYMAFCDLRILARDGRTEQAHALADAFHNIPLLMHRSDFSLQAFRDSLGRYQERFGDKLIANYLEEMEKLNLAP